MAIVICTNCNQCRYHCISTVMPPSIKQIFLMFHFVWWLFQTCIKDYCFNTSSSFSLLSLLDKTSCAHNSCQHGLDFSLNLWGLSPTKNWKMLNSDWNIWQFPRSFSAALVIIIHKYILYIISRIAGSSTSTLSHMADSDREREPMQCLLRNPVRLNQIFNTANDWLCQSLFLNRLPLTQTDFDLDRVLSKMN